MKKIAVFASGNGSNFQVIAEEFPVEFVFSDHRDAFVLERAEKLGTLSYAFELKEFESKADYEAALVELLEEHQIDLICLAGYIKIHFLFKKEFKYTQIWFKLSFLKLNSIKSPKFH